MQRHGQPGVHCRYGAGCMLSMRFPPTAAHDILMHIHVITCDAAADGRLPSSCLLSAVTMRDPCFCLLQVCSLLRYCCTTYKLIPTCFAQNLASTSPTSQIRQLVPVLSMAQLPTPEHHIPTQSCYLTTAVTRMSSHTHPLLIQCLACLRQPCLAPHL